LNLNILASELACKIKLYSTMDDNGLLIHTDFNFPAPATLRLFAAKQDEFTFYFPLRLKGDHTAEASLPSITWKDWEVAPKPDTGHSGGHSGKSFDQFLAEFDFGLVGFANSFSVYKYRYSGNFPEEVRLRLIAADLKSRLHAVSASTEAGKQMSRRFTFYDISKLENLDLESKKALLFGKKIVDSVSPKAPHALPPAPVILSLADLGPDQNDFDPSTSEKNGVGSAENLRVSVRNQSDKHQTEVFFSAEKGEDKLLKREDFLLNSPPSGLTKGPSPRRFHGVIKVFFDEEKYGFLESQDYGQDVYVSLDELKKAGVTKKTVRKNRAQVYSFVVHEYHRKHKLARKAVEIEMEEPN